jgi:hypothetical protein
MKKLSECNPDAIIKTLQYCMVCYYGIYPTNIPTVLIEEGCRKLLSHYSTLTLEEIKHSYDRLNIEKKEITLNLSNIIDPVKKYHAIKYKLSDSLQVLRREAEKEQIRMQETLAFEEISLKVYRESLQAGEWKGDIFNSHAIAKKYLADKLEQPIKTELWKEAQKDFYRISNDLDLFIQNSGVTEIRLFSELIVKHCIDKKVEI